MVGVGAEGARRTLIAIRTFRDLADQSSRAAGNPKFGVGDSFLPSPAKARRPSRIDPQTISFRANALNSRGIVGAGNPGWFAATTWWWTQSCETSLHWANSLPAGKSAGNFYGLGHIWRKSDSEITAFSSRYG